jgi:Flp pilus assembly pilin Flp
MATIVKYLRTERGAEMAEWVVAVALLTIVAAGLLGPGGMLHAALATGLNQIAASIPAS